jgi:hypothetical protein
VPAGQIFLRLSGAPVRNGQVPVEAFALAMRKFAATMAFFERVYTERQKRSSDLNVSSLTRENPWVVGLNAVSRLRGYSPDPAFHWAFNQINLLAAGSVADPRLPVELLDNIYDMSIGQNETQAITRFTAQFGAEVIDFNGTLANFVRARRIELVSSIPEATWFAGVSKGTIFGELRGVTDIDGEREFFVVPPRGPHKVKCVFTEEMRPDMIRFMFKPVTISGLLHFDGGSPHPTLVEAISIIEMGAPPGPHMRDLEGLFNNGHYPIEVRWPQ